MEQILNSFVLLSIGDKLSTLINLLFKNSTSKENTVKFFMVIVILIVSWLLYMIYEKKMIKKAKAIKINSKEDDSMIQEEGEKLFKKLKTFNYIVCVINVMAVFLVIFFWIIGKDNMLFMIKESGIVINAITWSIIIIISGILVLIQMQSYKELTEDVQQILYRGEVLDINNLQEELDKEDISEETELEEYVSFNDEPQNVEYYEEFGNIDEDYEQEEITEDIWENFEKDWDSSTDEEDYFEEDFEEDTQEDDEDLLAESIDIEEELEPQKDYKKYVPKAETKKEARKVVGIENLFTGTVPTTPKKKEKENRVEKEVVQEPVKVEKPVQEPIIRKEKVSVPNIQRPTSPKITAPDLTKGKKATKQEKKSTLQPPKKLGGNFAPNISNPSKEKVSKTKEVKVPTKNKKESMPTGRPPQIKLPKR